MHQPRTLYTTVGILIALSCIVHFRATGQSIDQVTISSSGWLGITNITPYKNKLYFFGSYDNYRNKLLSSDGIGPGTTLVKQLDNATFLSAWNMYVTNNLLVFFNNNKVWRSDGTEAGTFILKNISIYGATTGAPSHACAVLNDKLYFAGDSTQSNPVKDQLWVTDGTVGGTKLVKTINPSGPAGIGGMFVSDGKLYFYAYDGSGNGYWCQPWVSDGTPAGTFKLKAVKSTIYGDALPMGYTPYNGKVYFRMTDDTSATQLWVTDGTSAGTTKVTKIFPKNTMGLYPTYMAVYNSKLYFTGYDSTLNPQLWVTDGTAAGTKILKADSTSRKRAGFQPGNKVGYHNKLYMSAWDSVWGLQLWSTDGTLSGTTRITSKQGYYPQRIIIYQDKIVMTAMDTLSKMEEVFISDGTAAGTVCPKPPVVNSQAFVHFDQWVPFQNALYFRAAYTYWQDYELYRVTFGASSVGDASMMKAPERYALAQNFPNPFNPSTTISFTLPGNSFVSLKVFDIIGREVATLVSESMHAGTYQREWNAGTLPSGVYFYRIQAGVFTETKKLLLTR
ncbi:MAG TPA: T9SS type A sorting domain-containing protein [Bacteroidota bacterium]|nr:T9SS type A sorting domain-containing protein [Bacteroidota bacterium]